RTFYFIFFFQAEDGIRDSSVTGVQTCALPISARRADAVGWLPRGIAATARLISSSAASASALEGFGAPCGGIRPERSWKAMSSRSEERRVGKECRCRGAPECGQKKEESRMRGK